jgi:hypothetical protein
VIWLYTVRRLAWPGNIAAATRSAHRIQAEYSRAGALLAVARAYLRTGNSAAAQRILKRVAPTIRATQSPLAAKTARKLFAEARTFPYSDEYERDESYDARRAIVAYYQAKCGWSQEAIATAGGELSNLGQAKSILIARREWTLLRAFADKLPLVQAADFLLELSGAQLHARDTVAACTSLEAARQHFSSLSRAEQESETQLPTRLRLALLEIANGDEAQGWMRYTKISQSPHFNARWEFAFYYLLIEPRNQSLLHFSPEQRVSYEHKALAALARIQAPPYQVQPFGLLDIARAQKARGDLSAVRQTLQQAKSEIRSELLAPLAEYDNKICSVCVRQTNCSLSPTANETPDWITGQHSRNRKLSWIPFPLIVLGYFRLISSPKG